MKKNLIALVLMAFTFNTYASVDSPLSKRIQNLNNIMISSHSVRADIISGDFDAVFSLYDNIESEKINMQHFSPTIGTTDVVNKLADDQRNIIDYAYNTVKNNTGKIIPRRNNNYKPNGLIVLGSTPKLGILESRLNQAYTLAIKYPNMPIILSGKGRKNNVIEADYMYDYLKDKGVETKRMYKESESLDTVGNAEFSYFTIQENPSLNKIKNWLVITNNYHAMRSLFNFSRIFPESYTISVLLAPLLPDGITNPDEDKILKNLIGKEIKSDSNEQFMELLRYNRYSINRHKFKSQNLTGKPCAILNEILLEHGLYKDNVDKFTNKFSQCYEGLDNNQ
ncbi:YdcF family protein [Aliivibrio logei]|uniref:YdcF family protein n=2 Tax=Aliivibrio logei TaxID=688 RepID=UPI0003AA57A5|nr:YdcF family protein [Aliivibrio logei]